MQQPYRSAPANDQSAFPGLHVVGDQPPITGEQLLARAAQIAARYLRSNLYRLDSNDPLRADVEARSRFGMGA